MGKSEARGMITLSERFDLKKKVRFFVLKCKTKPKTLEFVYKIQKFVKKFEK